MIRKRPIGGGVVRETRHPYWNSKIILLWRLVKSIAIQGIVVCFSTFFPRNILLRKFSHFLSRLFFMNIERNSIQWLMVGARLEPTPKFGNSVLTWNFSVFTLLQGTMMWNGVSRKLKEQSKKKWQMVLYRCHWKKR